MKKNLQAQFAEITVYQDQTEHEVISSGRALHALTGECIGDEMYLFASDCNSIVSVNRITGTVKTQYGDERQPYSREYLYTDSLVYEGMIYFVSNKLPYVLKFDPVSGLKKYIAHNGLLINYLPCRYGKRLFLLPVEYSDRIISVDLSHDAVSYIPCIYPSDLMQAAQRVNEVLLFGLGIQVGRYVYQGSRVNSSLRQFDLETGKEKYLTVEGFQRPIRQMAFDGTHLWLLSLDGLLAQWDYRKNKIIFSLNLSKEIGQQNVLYVACFCQKDAVYILENRGSCILKFNIQEKVLSQYDCSAIPGFQLKRPEGLAFSEGIRVNDKGAICFFPYLANGIFCWNTEDKVQFYLTVSAKALGRAVTQQLQTESTCGLADFCDRLTQSDKIEKKFFSVGKTIIEHFLGKG